MDDSGGIYGQVVLDVKVKPFLSLVLPPFGLYPSCQLVNTGLALKNWPRDAHRCPTSKHYIGL